MFRRMRSKLNSSVWLNKDKIERIRQEFQCLQKKGKNPRVLKDKIKRSMCIKVVPKFQRLDG